MKPFEHLVFIAHLLCFPYLCQTVKNAVKGFNNAWLLSLQQKELFETVKVCFCCLQAFALSCSFTVVTTTFKKNRVQFACIHHDSESKNWRKLKNHIEKNTAEAFVTQQKQDTSSNTRGCTWELYWSVRSVKFHKLRKGLKCLNWQLKPLFTLT